MQDLLKRCFYDKMTVTEAVKFIEKSYSKKVTEKQVETAKANIKKVSNIDWE